MYNKFWQKCLCTQTQNLMKLFLKITYWSLRCTACSVLSCLMKESSYHVQRKRNPWVANTVALTLHDILVSPVFLSLTSNRVDVSCGTVQCIFSTWIMLIFIYVAIKMYLQGILFLVSSKLIS